MVLKKLTAFALCAVVALTPGCAALGMTPEQRESARASLTQQRDVGNISEAQYDAAIEALDSPDGWLDWESLGYAGAAILLSVFTGVPVAVARVNKKRGPTEAQRQAAKTAKAS